MILSEINKDRAKAFIQSRHYSPIMPKLTKHYMGVFVDNELQGVITFGWGTRPKHTIQVLFPDLDTKDYFEIGKMCMDDSMPRNSESQMLRHSVRWLKENTDIKYLFTWADGIVGKVGYVYQGSNFLYGGFSTTDTYVTEKGEKIHPRTMQGVIPNTKNRKYGMRPNPEQLKEMNISRVKGRQFRYIFPMTKRDRKYLKNSTVTWNLDYPKEKDLIWKIKKPGETSYNQTERMPFDLSKETEINKQKYDGASLDKFF